MNPRCAAYIINAVRNPARPAGLLASDGRRQRRPKFSTPKNAACLAIHAQRSLSMFSADADALRVRALNVYQCWVSPTLGRSWHCQSTAAESEGQTHHAILRTCRLSTVGPIRSTTAGRASETG